MRYVASMSAMPSIALLTGCPMSKSNITSFGKVYKYLSDPELRRKETGDQEMIVKGALFSGARFQYLTWRNIKFVDCDFAGGYEIKLDAMENCSFEGCKIVGIHEFGTMSNVQFYKCLSGGASVWGGNIGSKGVTFDSCQFIGDTADQNHQGGIGTYGEVTFVNCKIKWFAVTGYTKLVLKSCECESVRTSLNNEQTGSAVLIENCKLRGTFDMVPASLQSLTIRDTQIDVLDLTGASVKGDVVMERVKGGTIKAGILARNFTLKDSQVYGPSDQRVFVMGIEGAEQFLIDNVQFASGLQDQVGLGAGRPLEANEWSVVPRNKRAVIRNSKLPRVDASWLETQHLQLQGNEIGSLDLSNSRIGQLEISGNTISRGVDFSHTQAKQANVQRLRGDQAKLEGSNIKMPR